MARLPPLMISVDYSAGAKDFARIVLLIASFRKTLYWHAAERRDGDLQALIDDFNTDYQPLLEAAMAYLYAAAPESAPPKKSAVGKFFDFFKHPFNPQKEKNHGKTGTAL